MRTQQVLNSPETSLPGSCTAAPVNWVNMDYIHRGPQDDKSTKVSPGEEYVSQNMHENVIQWVHIFFSSIHANIQKPERLIENNFWWQTLGLMFGSLLTLCSLSMPI